MYDDNNIFAKIIRKEVPANIVYEDEKLVAFHDINKRANVHVLVIPKAKFVSYQDFINHSDQSDIIYFFKKINDIAEELNIKDSYRLITNHGAEMGQVVFHFHVHILGGGKLN